MLKRQLEERKRGPGYGRLPRQVTICGGGNGAHVCAGFLAWKGIKVNVLTRRPREWAPSIEIITQSSSWEAKGTFAGTLHVVSDEASRVVPGSEYVIIAAPANAHPALLTKVAPHLDFGAKIGALFAQGGFDWAVKHAFGTEKIKRIGVMFGLQNIPWICKAVKYGHSARILGPKKGLWVATYPVEARDATARDLESMFDIPCHTLPNFLNLTLTPSNQIIHPARYYAIFRDWDGKRSYSRRELEAREGLTLYKGMDEYSAECLATLDNELQQIKFALLQRFPQLDLSYVMPIGERIVNQYGDDVTNRSSLRQIFRSNRGYSSCLTPLKEQSPGRYQPLVESRLFWEDIPYGLVILKNLVELLGNFPTPAIDFMIRWHQTFMEKDYLLSDNQLNPRLLHETGAPCKYGIHRVEEIVETCLPRELLGYRHPRARM
ncbi:hypothetical protein NSK_002118 [Nannochloropsis salina CCMP1776]|uniref:Opine dehydrogenase domain-containing protein n=1 Tax=Nannochloropsis salina CCMP1776 TaxID=1027361 RepID=A0A4D9D401_9STRA|nr:hypothetical protein NSK_002118 [Nannochloropsis salina CCMP1776]|eukprot:TFJ86461.1 hypothetical protein NSK_002118 [Nannochloropsis salina CCMP1776]